MDKLSLYLTDGTYNSNWAVRNSEVGTKNAVDLDVGT